MIPADDVQSTGLSVTAIIPTYNRAGYLREALSSVLGQTLPPDQVIVVDDGSKDNTREVVAKFGSRVQYISKPNGGKSSALNLGLRHTTGDLVWIFDDDDIAEPDALCRLVNALLEHPECGFAYGSSDCFTMDGANPALRAADNLPSVNPADLFLSVLVGGFTSAERRFVYQQGLLVRKSCYDEVGAFDESLVRSQDFEMLVRLAHRYSAVKVEAIVFHLRVHAGMRGPEAFHISEDNVIEVWLRNEQRLLVRIYETYDLRDFAAGKSSGWELTEEQKFTALLQRCCIMARRGLWDQAALDLHQASETAQSVGKRKLTAYEEAILRLFFDLSSFGPHTFENPSEFRRALKNFKPAPLQRQVLGQILWSLPFCIGAALLHRQYANFRRFLGVYFALATPDAVLRTIFSRSFLRAGMELVRARRAENIPGRSKKRPGAAAQAV